MTLLPDNQGIADEIHSFISDYKLTKGWGAEELSPYLEALLILDPSHEAVGYLAQEIGFEPSDSKPPEDVANDLLDHVMNLYSGRNLPSNIFPISLLCCFSVDPLNYDARTLFVKIMCKTGEKEVADEVVDSILKQTNNSVEATILACDLWRYKGNGDKAFEWSSLAIARAEQTGDDALISRAKETVRSIEHDIRGGKCSEPTPKEPVVQTLEDISPEGYLPLEKFASGDVEVLESVLKSNGAFLELLIISSYRLRDETQSQDWTDNDPYQAVHLKKMDSLFIQGIKTLTELAHHRGGKEACKALFKKWSDLADRLELDDLDARDGTIEEALDQFYVDSQSLLAQKMNFAAKINWMTRGMTTNPDMYDDLVAESTLYLQRFVYECDKKFFESFDIDDKELEWHMRELKKSGLEGEALEDAAHYAYCSLNNVYWYFEDKTTPPQPKPSAEG